MSASQTEEERAQVLNAYKAKVREHREMESRCVSLSLSLSLSWSLYAEQQRSHAFICSA